MGKFIELRFGQGDLGRSLGLRKDIEPGETFVQREIVPLKAIKDAYVILPEGRNISITFESKGRLFTRVEYYKDRIDCIKRWTMIRKACGMTARDLLKNPLPLPMDAGEMEKKEGEKKDGQDQH